jgi:hypothetical protein
MRRGTAHLTRAILFVGLILVFLLLLAPFDPGGASWSAPFVVLLAVIAALAACGSRVHGPEGRRGTRRKHPGRSY